MNRYYVEWLNATFIVINASQPAETVLSATRYYKIAWIVLYLGDKKSIFYVCMRTELESMLRNKKLTLSAKTALGLREEDASLVARAGKRIQAPEQARFIRVMKSARRLVQVNKKGNVTRIGKLSLRRRALRSERSTSMTLAGQRERASRAFGRTRITQQESDRAVAAFLKSGPGKKHLGKKPAHEYRVSDGSGAPPSTETVSSSAAGAGTSREYNLVKIFYATDRAIKSSDENGNTLYANERNRRGELLYGTCDVSIPFSHTRGKIEVPSIWKFWKFEFRENPRKHIVLLKTLQQQSDIFFQQMRDTIDRDKTKSAFVFIHGYNVHFEDAAKRTAQLAFDLKFTGAPILYSWPSRARVKAYSSDAETIELTKPQLVNFLAEIAKRSGARVIHLIAHSMGNRALVRALNEIACRQVVKNRPKFRQIVLAAPDVNRDEFTLLADGVRKMGRRVTLYGSSKDIPLYFSKRVNEYERVGYFGREIVIFEKIDTIDASSVKTDFLAHMPAKGKTILLDLSDLIRNGLPPDDRPALTKKTIAAGDYWEFAK
jgi:esterase/lipase superfamily enzyme